MELRDFIMEPGLELGDIQPHGPTICHAGPLDLGGALRLDGVLSWFLPYYTSTPILPIFSIQCLYKKHYLTSSMDHALS